jgi:hypothetical protein
MRTPIWLRLAAALLVPACAMSVDESASETENQNATLDFELGLEGFDPDECPGKPGLPLETELLRPEVPAQNAEPPVVTVWQPGELTIVGESGARPGNLAAQIDAHYLEAYPHFDDCTLPGHTCW